MPTRPEPIVILRPSPLRRGVAIVFICIFATLCFVGAFFRPLPGAGWTFALLLIGAIALWLGLWLARATRTWIELTEEGLHDGNGRTLATLDEIATVSRAAFAIKPSNGFVVHLIKPAPRAWQPGLWWRFGRRLGIGGVTPNMQSRAMADTLTVMLEEKRSGPKG